MNRRFSDSPDPLKGVRAKTEQNQIGENNVAFDSTFRAPEPAQMTPPPEPEPIGRTARELVESTPEEPDWLIPGLLAPGTVTELNAREKAGKGWLEAYMVGSLERGERTVFGESTRKTKTLIFTEEPHQTLREKFQNFGIMDAYVVFHWEMGQMKWEEIVNWLTEFMAENDHELLFIDNISSATRTQDEAGVELARKVEQLVVRAKEHDFAVLYDRHQRKAAGKIEDLSRGTTSLAGAVDCIVAMEKDEGRIRKLTSRGRLFAHNWDDFYVELDENLSTYNRVIGDHKLKILVSREHWTAPEFALAIGLKDDSARSYLQDSPYCVEDGKEGKATRWRVNYDLPTLS